MQAGRPRSRQPQAAQALLMQASRLRSRRNPQHHIKIYAKTKLNFDIT